MELILNIAWYVMVALLGIIALVLLTPIRLRVKGGRETGLGWIEGYGGVPLRLLGMEAVISERATQYRLWAIGIPVWSRPIPFGRSSSAKTRRTKAPKRQRVGFMDTIDRLRAPHLTAVAGRLFRLLNPRGYAAGEVGFDDPVDTAMLAWAVAMLERTLPGLKLDIQLNYVEETLRGAFELRVLVFLPQILVGAIATALCKEGRALIAYLLTLRKRGAAQAAHS